MGAPNGYVLVMHTVALARRKLCAWAVAHCRSRGSVDHVATFSEAVIVCLSL